MMLETKYYLTRELYFYVASTYEILLHESTAAASATYPSFFTSLSMTDIQKTKAVSGSWLLQSDYSLVFARNPPSEGLYKYLAIGYRQSEVWPALRAQVVLLSKYAPQYADWFIFAHDDAFLLIDSIKYALELFDPDKRYMAVLGSDFGEGETEQQTRETKKLRSTHILSHAALEHLQNRIGTGTMGCSLTQGTLHKCLDATVELDLTRDVLGNTRSPLIARHLTPFEIKDYRYYNGGYNDGSDIINNFSPDLLSLHGLEAQDIKIFDVLFNRIRKYSAIDRKYHL
ncbi:unnamed protein product, partial [Mesorhabditis spiculigera]